MSHDARVWQVKTGDLLVEINTSKLDFESRLENWLKNDISILDNDLLVIGSQVLTDFGGYIDLLCIDSSGDIIVVELKKDKTPRDTVAQALDYASWVVNLSYERVIEIANQYLNQPFGDVFQNKFGIELPESINSNHKIVVVASKIDQKSERIISYLSNGYGVNINAATFQYFQTTEGVELLTRVFLIEPELVDSNTKSKGSSKRNPNLTLGQFYDIASDNGYKDLRYVIEKLKPLFPKINTNKSKINLYGSSNGKSLLLMNLIPKESSQSDGLKFEILADRSMFYFNLTESELKAILPPETKFWEYDQHQNDMKGYQGFFTSIEQLDNFVQKLSPAKV
jgi:hypothetical protein